MPTYFTFPVADKFYVTIAGSAAKEYEYFPIGDVTSFAKV